MKRLLSIVLFLISFVNLLAQSRGKIAYKIEFTSDKPEMAMALPMMQGSTMELAFMPEKARANIMMGVFMKMNTITDSKTQKGLLLMEMMGNKTATPIDISNKNSDVPKLTVVKSTNETKDILGFKCTKTILKDENGNEFTIWASKDLKGSFKGIQQLEQFPVDGVPLEFTFDSNRMKAYFVATKFDKDVDEAMFKQDIPEGFTLVKEDELASMGQ